MIRIEELTFRYPGGHPALDAVSTELPRGEISAVLGPSGSGKTTLLHCLGRFLSPQEGRIAIDDRELGDLGEVELRQTVGIVFQELHLFPHLSVLENLTLAPVRVLGRTPDVAATSARSALDRFGIGELAERYPSEISGGQAQRVAIARALLLRPAYLLLDEPTSALDVQSSRELGEWLLDLREETSFVLVTHDIGFARDVASYGVLLAKGRVRAEGAPSALVREWEEASAGSDGF